MLVGFKCLKFYCVLNGLESIVSLMINIIVVWFFELFWVFIYKTEKWFLVNYSFLGK